MEITAGLNRFEALSRPVPDSLPIFTINPVASSALMPVDIMLPTDFVMLPIVPSSCANIVPRCNASICCAGLSIPIDGRAEFIAPYKIRHVDARAFGHRVHRGFGLHGISRLIISKIGQLRIRNSLCRVQRLVLQLDLPLGFQIDQPHRRLDRSVAGHGARHFSDY